MIEGSGSVPLTNGSGSWRTKNMQILRIQIHNTIDYHIDKIPRFFTHVTYLAILFREPHYLRWNF
jgi:hypothetical protein